MSNQHETQHRALLQRIAHRAMLENGLAPKFPADALKELDRIDGAAPPQAESSRDLRDLLWCERILRSITTHSRTPRRSTQPPRFFRCFPRSFPRISPRSTRIPTA